MTLEDTARLGHLGMELWGQSLKALKAGEGAGAGTGAGAMDHEKDQEQASGCQNVIPDCQNIPKGMDIKDLVEIVSLRYDH